MNVRLGHNGTRDVVLVEKFDNATFAASMQGDNAVALRLPVRNTGLTVANNSLKAYVLETSGSFVVELFSYSSIELQQIAVSICAKNE